MHLDFCEGFSELDADRPNRLTVPISEFSPAPHFLNFIFLSKLEQSNIIVRIATPEDLHFSTIITDEMAASAQARGTGIAKRSVEYIEQKITEGKSVIAVTERSDWVGFCYIEAWGKEGFVANSGLIVSPAFRKTGIAKKIKKSIFELSKKRYPSAKIFGLTTGLAVMKINSDLGYEPVTYSELTDDENFWAGCKSCVNYDILMSKDRKNCMCTAMLYDPADHYEPAETAEAFSENAKSYERFMRIKQSRLLRFLKNKKSVKNKSILSFFFNF